MAEQEAREHRKHTKRERPHQSGTQNKQHNVPSSAKQPRIRIGWHPRDPPPRVQRARLTADRHRGAGRADTRSAAHGWGKRARWPGVVPRRGRGRPRRHTAADTGTRPRPPRPSGTPGATSLSVRCGRPHGCGASPQCSTSFRRYRTDNGRRAPAAVCNARPASLWTRRRHVCGSAPGGSGVRRKASAFAQAIA